MQGALERGVGLQADDGLALGVLGVDVAGLVGQNARHDLGVHVQDAALLALLEKQRHDVIPQLDGALGGTHQERLVALVRGIVLLDEVADVNLVEPIAALEAFPCLLHCVTTLLVVLAGRPRPKFDIPGNNPRTFARATRRKNARAHVKKETVGRRFIHDCKDTICTGPKGYRKWDFFSFIYIRAPSRFAPPNAQVQCPPAHYGRLASRPGIIDIGKRRLTFASHGPDGRASKPSPHLPRVFFP